MADGSAELSRQQPSCAGAHLGAPATVNRGKTMRWQGSALMILTTLLRRLPPAVAEPGQSAERNRSVAAL